MEAKHFEISIQIENEIEIKIKKRLCKPCDSWSLSSLKFEFEARGCWNPKEHSEIFGACDSLRFQKGMKTNLKPMSASNDLKLKCWNPNKEVYHDHEGVS